MFTPTPFSRSSNLAPLTSLPVTISNTSILEYSPTQAGLFTTAPIPFSSISESIKNPLVSVPLSFILSRKTAIDFAASAKNPFCHSFFFRKADGSPIPPSTPYSQFPLSDRDILARFLLFHILSSRRGDKSDFWTLWVQSLPPLADINLPFTWSSEKLDSLYGSSVYEAARAKIEFLKYRYTKFFADTQLRKEIADYITSGPDPVLNTPAATEITFDDWLLVESWISSRSLQVLEVPANETTDSENSLRLGLVPVIDMCNHHDTECNAKYEIDFPSGSISLVATKQIPKGSQIYINYGDKGAAEMLYTYGFMPNSSLEATFVVPPVVDDDTPNDDTPNDDDTTTPNDDTPNDNDDDDATMVLRAKSKMYGERPRLFKVFQDGNKVSWSSSFVTFLALPADHFSFQSNPPSNPDTILFANTPIDLDNIDSSIRPALHDSLLVTVKQNMSTMAEALVKNVFLPGLNERTDNLHPLVLAERHLLEKLSFDN